VKQAPVRHDAALCIVAPDFWPTTGGYAHAITNAAVALSRAGVHVRVLTPVPGEPCLGSVEVVRLPAAGARLASGVWEVQAARLIRSWYRQGAIRAVLLETGEFGILGCALLANRVPTMVRLHAATETEIAFFDGARLDLREVRSSLYRIYHSAWTRRFLRTVRTVLSTSRFHVNFHRDVILNGNSVASARRQYFVLPNFGPSVEAPAPCTSASPHAPDGMQTVVSLGRLDAQGVEQKGIRDLLQAWALLGRRRPGGHRGVKLVVVGDGAARASLIHYAGQLGLASSVSFIARLPHAEVLELVRASNGIALLSRYEGMSMFALEAVAAGVPMLATRVGGLPDLVVDGTSGWLVQPQDVQAAAQGLEALLACDREAVGTAARAHYEEHLAPDVLARQFRDILELAVPAVRAEAHAC
jgi:glycosyltransferase involved in cell wall biosynthesis